MNAACTPNGAATRFVPGSGIILQIICLAADSCAPRPSAFAAASHSQASNEKNPAGGSNRAAGCCKPEAEARVIFIFH
jgi:hypothetical protein